MNAPKTEVKIIPAEPGLFILEYCPNEKQDIIRRLIIAWEVRIDYVAYDKPRWRGDVDFKTDCKTYTSTWPVLIGGLYEPQDGVEVLRPDGIVETYKFEDYSCETYVEWLARNRKTSKHRSGGVLS